MEMGFEPSSHFRACTFYIVALFECSTTLEINNFFTEGGLKIHTSCEEVNGNSELSLGSG